MNNNSSDLNMDSNQLSGIHQKMNPMKVIRKHCLSCCCESPKEVRLCPVVKCHLHPYRMGKNPFRKSKVLTDEQRNEMVDRIKGDH